MNTEDIRTLLQKRGFKKAPEQAWQKVMPSGISYWIKGNMKLELNSASRSIKNLVNFSELSYQYSKLEDVEALLRGK